MRPTFAAAIVLCAGLVPAAAAQQAYPLFPNFFQFKQPNVANANPDAMKRYKRTRSVERTQRTRHTHSHAGASTSRACLTAQTRAVLSQLEAKFGPVKVISTCRPGAVIAGSGKPSQHRYGKAVDLVPPSGQRAAVLSWLRSNAGGAVLTYRSGHVHFDTGPWRTFACGDCGTSRKASRVARRAYAHVPTHM